MHACTLYICNVSGLQLHPFLTLLIMSQVQITMPPVLQSGGNYDLKWNAQTDEEACLHLPGKGIPAVHVSRLAVPPTCI